jgi:hypothetical protein
MNTLTDTAVAAVHKNGEIIVHMESGAKIRFPVTGNLRLAQGTPAQLNHIEISPFGLHWPDLDEDLSFHGLQEGAFGQFQKQPIKRMSIKHFPKGLDGRQRAANGEIREKRGDTRVGTLRKEYGVNFAKGYRSDTKLSTVRDTEGKKFK